MSSLTGVDKSPNKIQSWISSVFFNWFLSQIFYVCSKKILLHDFPPHSDDLNRARSFDQFCQLQSYFRFVENCSLLLNFRFIIFWGGGDACLDTSKHRLLFFFLTSHIMFSFSIKIQKQCSVSDIGLSLYL